MKFCLNSNAPQLIDTPCLVIGIVENAPLDGAAKMIDEAKARLACRQVAADFAGTLVGLRASEIADEMRDKLAERDYDTGLHYLKRGLVDSALLYLEEVFEEYPESPWAPWALYRMIEGFEKINYVRDIETTRGLLLEIYPDSEASKLLENGGS